jgi:RNA polymerase sigma factor (sigma-70 family)
MDTRPARGVLREIRTLYTLGTLGGLTDSQLLDRFLARGGDDAGDAFAALVHRHGPMVRGVCRRMLPTSHDAEDAFQATFFVLARRAASIGRREQLGRWLYGVAVRTAKEARRLAARQRAIERQMMTISRFASEPPEDRDDVVLLLDEELSRLPERYRSALVACELEGKSRREAAGQLGIPEGTLSAYLARGRKRLHERLLRRGVTLGVGPIAGLSPPSLETAIPERLLEPIIRAAMGHAPGCGAAGAISQTVSSLAERVIKMMFLARLTVLIAAFLTASTAITAVVLAWPAPAAAPAIEDPPRVGKDDLAGRVIDKAGTAVADVQVWAIGGRVVEPVTVARATTDRQGRYVLPGAWAHKAAKALGDQRLGVFARAPDGRVGWLTNYGREELVRQGGEIELQPVSEVRGRVTDQDVRPITGATIATEGFWKPTESGFRELMELVPETAAAYAAHTAADGSFALKAIPQGSLVEVKITPQGREPARVSWNTAQPAVITLDHRLGRIKGRLKPTDAGGFTGEMLVRVSLDGPRGKSAPGPVTLRYNAGMNVSKDGSFRFDGLPPGHYELSASSEKDAPFIAKAVGDIEVAPNGEATVEVPLDRLVTVTGRVIDAQTGKGVADIPVACYHVDNNSLGEMRSAQTDAEGRYSVLAQPGTVRIHAGPPNSYLGPMPEEYPNLEAKVDRAVPDLKLTHAIGLDGIVVDETGHPVPSAEVYFLFTPERRWSRRGEPMRTGSDGNFHLDQLDPNDKVGLWARAGDATTNGTAVTQPSQGKVTLTVDPKYTVRLRGLVTDSGGQRIAGAKVSLWWTRRDPPGKDGRPMGGISTVQDAYTTTEKGLFVFRNLWPGDRYNVVVEARGHNKGESSPMTGKFGETHDLGKIVLINTDATLAGRVVGSDGLPIVGAEVFNRGDAPGPVAKSTDSQGRFWLDGMLPGPRFVFVRKEGYRFTGVKNQGDSDGMTITLKKATEPPPAWKPVTTASRDEERAFAKQVLIRIWQKYSSKADSNGAFSCIPAMAEIDPDLAAQWSAEKGHRYDDDVRFAHARTLAETDAEEALALLNQKPDSASQRALHELADRFAESDLKKALRFAEEAAVQSRGLNQPDRTLAMARAGAVLVKLGREDVGRKLIDEAARDAAQLPVVNRGSYHRALVSGILAPYDVERALALVEPIKSENQEGPRNRARIAAAIATTNTKRSVELVETVGGNAFYHEMARTAIAYQIGRDHPDDAIKITRDMKRDPATIWQAEAFGWLAVALAPRDQARANGLIDQALAMMIFERDWASRSAWSGGEMAGAAHVALCARRIGYPDMESVVMRVIAARPTDSRNASTERTSVARAIAVSTVFLALLDPEAARTVLEQLESRAGFDLAAEWSTREPWLVAWVLVDLRKAQAVFESALASLDQQKEVNLWGTGFFEAVELLTAPPNRREAILYKRAFGAYWRPGGEF